MGTSIFKVSVEVEAASYLLVFGVSKVGFGDYLVAS
jgi:hypothetical protein